jgi:RNA polymerase sigma factor (sigma-70 family)
MSDKRFDMVAYSGGFMWPEGVKCVVDLAGLTWNTQSLPILNDHEGTKESVVGQSDAIKTDGKQLFVAGNLYADSVNGSDIAALSNRGHRWQVSIGATVLEAEDVQPGAVVVCNGQEFTGPFRLILRSQLREVSFVVLGADPSTSASIAARLRAKKGLQTMDPQDEKFGLWCTANKIDCSTMTEDAVKCVRAGWDAANAQVKATTVEVEDDSTEESESLADGGDAIAETPVKAAYKTGVTPTDIIAKMRKEAAAETKRMAAVSRVTEGHLDIRAKALNPEECLISAQKRDLIRTLITQLNERYQVMVEMRYFENRTYAEIAAEMCVPLGTVKAQLHRAREILHDLLCTPDAAAY